MSGPGLAAILSSGGWTRDAGGVVRLTTATDQVGIGTTAPLAGSRLDVAANDAVNAGATDVLVVDHTTSGVAAAGIGTSILLRTERTDGALVNAGQMVALLTNTGSGTENSALDFYTRNAGGVLTSRWRMDTTGDWNPRLDSAYPIGTSSLRVSDMVSNAFRVFATLGDVNATLQLTTGSIQLGPGAGVALDLRQYRSGAKTLTFDDGAGGDIITTVLGVSTITANNGVTNANTDVLTLVHSTTGVPADGIGAGLLFRAENPTGGAVTDAARIRANVSNYGGALAYGDLIFATRAAGAALTDRWRIEYGGHLFPLTDNALDVGSASARVGTVRAGTSFSLFGTIGAANPTAKMSDKAFSLGPGAGVALDWSLVRTGTAEASITGSLVTQGRTISAVFKVFLDSPYTVLATDDFVGGDPTAGAIVNLLPIAVTGRRITIKHTSDSANTVSATPNGAETIEGVAAATLLGLRASVTLVGQTGVGWHIT